MGAVYQAEHTHIHKRLAVKVLHPEMSRLPEVVARFEREAMAAAHIEHPNVAAATDFGKLEDGSFFLVLEYVEGRSCARPVGGPPRARSRAPHRARRLRARSGARPRARHRAPGPQARERHARRRATTIRTSSRCSTSASRRCPWARSSASAKAPRPGAHAARDGLRHSRVHGARAGAGAARRPARRPVRARRDDVRDDRRAPAPSSTRAR